MSHSTNATATIQALRQSSQSTAGLTVDLVSDNGPPFQSEAFAAFIQHNGIRHLRSPPFHPESNGQAEKAVQFFKDGMRKMTITPFQHRLAA